MRIDADLLESLSARAKESEPHSYALMCATNSRLLITEKRVVSLVHKVEALEKLIKLEAACGSSTLAALIQVITSTTDK